MGNILHSIPIFLHLLHGSWGTLCCSTSQRIWAISVTDKDHVAMPALQCTFCCLHSTQALRRGVVMVFRLFACLRPGLSNRWVWYRAHSGGSPKVGTAGARGGAFSSVLGTSSFGFIGSGIEFPKKNRRKVGAVPCSQSPLELDEALPGVCLASKDTELLTAPVSSLATCKMAPFRRGLVMEIHLAG